MMTKYEFQQRIPEDEAERTIFLQFLESLDAPGRQVTRKTLSYEGKDIFACMTIVVTEPDDFYIHMHNARRRGLIWDYRVSDNR